MTTEQLIQELNRYPKDAGVFVTSDLEGIETSSIQSFNLVVFNDEYTLYLKVN